VQRGKEPARQRRLVGRRSCLAFAPLKLALLGRNPENSREAIEEIVNDGNRASAIISRIRTLLMKGTPDRAELEINEVIREVPRLLRNELTRNRVSLRIELAPDLPPVPGDRVQLQQVVLNLIMNSIDAMRTVTDRRRELLIKFGKAPRRSVNSNSRLWIRT
jgi:C4-dicarboxylate-specific signal transduction histidine kinase